MRPLERTLRALVAVGLAFGLAACATTGTYVWAEDVPLRELTDSGERAYVIARGDVLAVRVYNQDALSMRGRVRPDGKIVVPLVGELDVVGRRPIELASELEARLRPYVVAPAVAVFVEEFEPVPVVVLGEVARPGVFSLPAGANVLQAIATAGGTTEYADGERIFLLRKRAAQPALKIRLSYARLTNGEGRGAELTLQAGDVVLVE
jgi:polysaccharide export outer membrane protein